MTIASIWVATCAAIVQAPAVTFIDEIVRITKGDIAVLTAISRNV